LVAARPSGLALAATGVINVAQARAPAASSNFVVLIVSFPGSVGIGPRRGRSGAKPNTAACARQCFAVVV
jgi:hypothetical protein